MIQFHHVNKQYPIENRCYIALKNVDFTIHAGSSVAIIGPSGSGKSTLMHILGLLDRPTSGKHLWFEQDMGALTAAQRAQWRNRYIGFIFQSFMLLPQYNAIQNVALPLLYRKCSWQASRARSLSLLKRVGLEQQAMHRPSQLSGGQQQRVAIARALIGNPSLILADEPTGALDRKTGTDIMDMLQDIHQKEKTTLCVVTHDLRLAERCQKIFEICDGVLKESK